jgi:hydrogenase nickel incorporation protein HypA/HybF
MHETGIVKDLVRRLEEVARAGHALRISRARVWIGALSQFSSYHFAEHFEEEARGTLAEGATLEVEISADLLDPAAQRVLIRSADLEVKE